MKSGTDLLKDSIRKFCPSGLQSKLRVFYVSRQILKNQSFHEPEMVLLKSLIVRGDHVGDIGANVGAYTMELSHLVGSDGHVYSFEPIAENYNILEKVVRRGRLANVRSFYAALGSVEGHCEMVIPDAAAFTGFYLAHQAHPGDSGRRETVEMLTLDSLWKANVLPKLDFIKCDVEGAELDVIRGGLELFRTQRPGWLIEVSRETSGELFGLLFGLGYKAFVYADKLIRTGAYRDKEFSNYFFFHPGSKIWSRALPLTAEG
jgi:FkbM family methyltransferase